MCADVTFFLLTVAKDRFAVINPYSWFNSQSYSKPKYPNKLNKYTLHKVEATELVIITWDWKLHTKVDNWI